MIVFPNPVEDRINVALNSDETVSISEVTTLSGRVLIRSGQDTQINVSALSQGLYFIKVTTISNKVYYRGFVKQ